MLKNLMGVSVKVSVDLDQVRDYWGIPHDKNPKRRDAQLFISHIIDLGLEKYDPKGGKNVQDISV